MYRQDTQAWRGYPEAPYLLPVPGGSGTYVPIKLSASTVALARPRDQSAIAASNGVLSVKRGGG
jgi:hypothetical protein